MKNLIDRLQIIMGNLEKLANGNDLKRKIAKQTLDELKKDYNLFLVATKHSAEKIIRDYEERYKNL